MSKPMWFYKLLDTLEIPLGLTVSLCGHCGQDAAIAYLPKPICRACSHKQPKVLYNAKDIETTVAPDVPLSAPHRDGCDCALCYAQFYFDYAGN